MSEPARWPLRPQQPKTLIGCSCEAPPPPLWGGAGMQPVSRTFKLPGTWMIQDAKLQGDWREGGKITGQRG